MHTLTRTRKAQKF